MARNWTPNTGECPVAEGTLVDVIHRDGETFKREIVEDSWETAASTKKGCSNWILEDCQGDIIFWRLSKEKKQ